MPGALAVGAPCGRPLNAGEEAALLIDTVYCADCREFMAPLGVEPRRFELRAGAVCGGGNPLD